MKTTTGYNVYLATPGSDLSFFGFADTIAAAKELSRSGNSLDASDWGSAKAAGHCGGIAAPEGIEDNDNVVWLHGDFCAVPVMGPTL